MDEFVQAIELLLLSDAGKLFLVFIFVMMVVMAFLSYMLLRIVLRILDDRKSDIEHDARIADAQSKVQQQMNNTMLQFARSVNDSVQRQTELIQQIGELIPVVQGNHEKREAEHKQQIKLSAGLVKLVQVVLRELRALPSSVAQELGEGQDYAPVIERIGTMERNLSETLVEAIRNAIQSERSKD